MVARSSSSASSGMMPMAPIPPPSRYAHPYDVEELARYEFPLDMNGHPSQYPPPPPPFNRQPSYGSSASPNHQQSHYMDPMMVTMMKNQFAQQYRTSPGMDYNRPNSGIHPPPPVYHQAQQPHYSGSSTASNHFFGSSESTSNPGMSAGSSGYCSTTPTLQPSRTTSNKSPTALVEVGDLFATFTSNDKNKADNWPNNETYSKENDSDPSKLLFESNFDSFQLNPEKEVSNSKENSNGKKDSNNNSEDVIGAKASKDPADGNSLIKAKPTSDVNDRSIFVEKGDPFENDPFFKS